MIMLLVETEATIATRMVARLVEVDEHARVTQWSAAAVARDLASLHRRRWNLGNQIDGHTRIHLQGEVNEISFDRCKLIP